MKFTKAKIQECVAWVEQNGLYPQRCGASIKQFCEPFDLFGGMIKGVVFGAIISIVGCFKGLNAKQGAEGVGLATTASVVLSIILIFIFDYFMTVLLYVGE